MFVNRTHGVVAATLGALTLAACTDPAQNTDLRPEGPPEVLAVLVMNDAAGMLNETATFCKTGDEKRPSLVGATQVCPDDLSAGADEVTNAYPDGWYVRIMFDELLNGDVETLTEVIDDATGEATGSYTGSIADTHPVKLECESINGGMVNVDYDGYYSPSGNRVTFPLGPSLVIKPNDPTLIATNTSCQVTINDNVLDKTGNPVPAEQRGPYKFKTAPIQVVVIDPSDKATIPASQMTTDGVYVQFNTTVDPASFCDDGAGMDECEFEFSNNTHGICSTSTSATGPVICEVAMNGAGCPGTGATCDTTPSATSLLPYGFTDTEFAFSPAAPNEVESDYTFQFKQGGKIADRCGRETTFGAPSIDDQTKINFSTDKFEITGTSIATGETASAMKKLTLSTSAMIDLSSLDATEYSFTPAATGANAGIDTNGGNDFTMFGFYKINTDYTFTLNAGATVKDVYGVEYTNPTALTVKWKTQPAITATFSPADASRVA
jgi:hypothetical protein